MKQTAHRRAPEYKSFGQLFRHEERLLVRWTFWMSEPCEPFLSISCFFFCKSLTQHVPSLALGRVHKLPVLAERFSADASQQEAPRFKRRFTRDLFFFFFGKQSAWSPGAPETTRGTMKLFAHRQLCSARFYPSPWPQTSIRHDPSLQINLLYTT